MNENDEMVIEVVVELVSWGAIGGSGNQGGYSLVVALAQGCGFDYGSGRGDCVAIQIPLLDISDIPLSMCNLNEALFFSNFLT